jgi:dihydropteroate synthase
MFTLNCKGRLLCIDAPIVMGIINATPDSFYAGSIRRQSDEIQRAALQMIEEGATIVDVGGQSTRPGSEKISAEEELTRVIPVIQAIRKISTDIFISIDTYYAKVAKEAVNAGADIVNDISAGVLDSMMAETVADLGTPMIAMHMKGNPQQMQQMTQYNDLIPDLLEYFTKRITHLHNAGVKDIIVDPGFGFSKTIEQNFALLNTLESFKILQLPLLIGVSRKSMIYKTLHTEPDAALNGTTVLHTIALMKGANILRAHDLKAAMECIRLTNALSK